MTGALLLLAHAVTAGDQRGVNPGGGSPAAKPTVVGDLLVPVRRQLNLAFGFAQERVRTLPTCSALFSRLGADGVALLVTTRFHGATFDRSGDTCGRGGVAAYTKVGSHQTRLCPGFGVLSVPNAALILIHEALHSAGMSEKPADPNGLTAQEINRLVEARCSL